MQLSSHSKHLFSAVIARKMKPCIQAPLQHLPLCFYHVCTSSMFTHIRVHVSQTHAGFKSSCAWGWYICAPPLTHAPLFSVRASVLWHKAWPAAPPDDQGVAAGSAQAAHLGPWRPAELRITAQAQTGLWQRAHQSCHDDRSLDLHGRGQHRWSTVHMHKNKNQQCEYAGSGEKYLTSFTFVIQIVYNTGAWSAMNVFKCWSKLSWNKSHQIFLPRPSRH